MKSAAPSPAPNQVAEAFNLPCRVPEQTTFNQQINPVLDFPQQNVCQQQNSFVRQPLHMTFQPFQKTNTQSNIHDFPQRSPRPRPVFLPSINQAEPVFSMSQQASGVFPIGPPIRSRGLWNFNRPDTNQLPPKLPVAGDSSEQNFQKLPSCQFEKTQEVSQSGPCLNPFIHFDPSNPLNFAGTDTTKSAASQLNQHSTEMGEKVGTDTGDKIDNGGTKDGSEKAGRVDIVGDTMYLRAVDNDSALDDQGVLQCPFCPQTCDNREVLVIHLQDNHLRNQEDKTRSFSKCYICGCDFFCDTDLLDHLQTVHLPLPLERQASISKSKNSTKKDNNNLAKANEKEFLDNGKQNTCIEGDAETEKINVSFEANKRMTLNLSAKTSEVQINNELNAENIQTVSPAGFDTEIERSWFCSICADTFTSEEEFNIHMHDKHFEKQEVSTKQASDIIGFTNLQRCDICGGEFFFQSDLQDHLETVHDTIDVCNIKCIESTSGGMGSWPHDGGGRSRGRPGGGARGRLREGALAVPIRGRGRGRGARSDADLVDGNIFTDRGGRDTGGIGSWPRDSRGRNIDRTRVGAGGRAVGEALANPSRGRGQGRDLEKCNSQRKSHKAIEEPCESNESDLEIIEQPKVVIEITDKDADINNPVSSEEKINETLENHPRAFLNFYCGLCAFKCRSNKLLDTHMETHSLSLEITQEQEELDRIRKKELLSNRYLKVHLEKLSEAELKCLTGKNRKQVDKLSGNCMTVDSSAAGKDLSSAAGVDSLLQKAGLGSSGLALEYTYERTHRQRMSQTDKKQLERHKIKEAFVDLRSFRTLETGSTKDKSAQENMDWLRGFSSDDVDSDIDWDLPDPTFDEDDDGYDADDNSDIVQLHRGGKRKPSQSISNQVNATLKTNIDLFERYDIKEAKVLITDVGKLKEDKIANFIKRELRSDKFSKPTDLPTEKVKNFHKKILRSDKKSKPTVPAKQEGFHSKPLASGYLDIVSRNLLKKYGIQESRVCIRNVCDPKNNLKRHIKRESSKIDISEASWWNESKVKDRIDFSKTPIVPLERIDINKFSGQTRITRKRMNQSEITELLSAAKKVRKSTKQRSYNMSSSIKMEIEVNKDLVIPRNLRRSERKNDSGHSSAVIKDLSEKRGDKTLYERKCSINIMKSRKDSAKLFGESLRALRDKSGNAQDRKMKTINRNTTSIKKKYIMKATSRLKIESPVKKSTRLMDIESSRRRKALEKAVQLIKKEQPRKCTSSQHDKISTLKIKHGSNKSQRSTIVILIDDEKPNNSKQRKKKFKNAKLTPYCKRDCEVKLFRLKAGDVTNWKQKEIQTENKIKALMTKLLTPAKLKSKIVVYKMSQSEIRKYTKESIPVKTNNVAQTVFSETDTHGNRLCGNEVKVNQTNDDSPFHIVSDLLDEIIDKIIGTCVEPELADDITGGEVIVDLTEKANYVSEESNIGAIIDNTELTSNTIASEIILEVVEKAFNISEKSNVADLTEGNAVDGDSHICASL